MKVVLDTNVLVSALLNPRGVPASILNAILDGSVTLLIDERILFEYRDVLQRPKFMFPNNTPQTLLEFFEHQGEYVAAGPVSATIADPGDVPFFEVAVAGDADYLVTGNAKHFPDEKMVVSPRELLDILRGDK